MREKLAAHLGITQLPEGPVDEARADIEEAAALRAWDAGRVAEAILRQREALAALPSEHELRGELEATLETYLGAHREALGSPR